MLRVRNRINRLNLGWGGVMSSSEPSTMPETGRPLTSRTQSRLFLYALGLLVIVHFPFLASHAEFLWLRSHFQFFPLVLLGASILGFSAYMQAGPLQTGSRCWSLGLVSLAWLLIAAAILLFSHFLGAIASMVTLLAVIHGVGGRPLVRALLPAWGFLWLIVPPPLSYDDSLILLLQTMVSDCNGPVLDVLRVRHYMDGNVVAVAGRNLMIGKTCSGILSLLPIMTCTLFLALWARMHLARAVALLIAAAFWDIVGNIARVVAIVFLFSCCGVDVSEGWPHEALGIVVFGLTLALIASTDRLVISLTATVKLWRDRVVESRIARRQLARCSLLDDPADPEVSSYPESPQVKEEEIETPRPMAPRTTNPPALPDFGQTWLSSRSIMAVYGVLGLLALTLFGPSIADFFRMPIFVQSINSLGEDALPAEWGSFRREKFEPASRGVTNGQGDHSRGWYYQWRGRKLAVVVDYPFRGWHELTVCYQLEGWKLEQESIHEEKPSAGTGHGPMTEAKFTQGQGRHGYLLFCMFNETGGSLERPQLRNIPPTDSVASRLKERLKFLGGDLRFLFWGVQVQLFLESDAPLSPAEEAEARSFFDHARQLIRQRISGGGGQNSGSGGGAI